METVANSPYAANTLIFVIEDDAQAGEDHVDAHRTTAFVVGPYVKQHKIISTPYNTVNMLRTMEEVLGISPLNLNDAHQPPMADIFDLTQSHWSFRAIASPSLKVTSLNTGAMVFARGPGIDANPQPTHDQDWWAQRTRGYDWSAEDRIPAQAYNRVLWQGMMGGRPYPSGQNTTNNTSRP